MISLRKVREKALAMTNQPAAYRVYQSGRLVGYLPGLPQRSTSRIFDIRPGDFKFGDLGDGMVIIAIPMIGPGDFACLPGFETAGGREAKSEAAETFNKLERDAEVDAVIAKMVERGFKP